MRDMKMIILAQLTNVLIILFLYKTAMMDCFAMELRPAVWEIALLEPRLFAMTG